MSLDIISAKRREYASRCGGLLRRISNSRTDPNNLIYLLEYHGTQVCSPNDQETEYRAAEANGKQETHRADEGPVQRVEVQNDVLA